MTLCLCGDFNVISQLTEKGKTVRLEGKVAILTGAGSGIGKETALLFAREGARVMVSGRREAPLKAVVDTIRSRGGSAAFCKADVTRGDQVQAMVQATLAEYGKLDIVVANAGIHPSRTDILETTEEAWHQTLATNLTGVFLTCKYSLPALIQNGGGSIVATSSMVGMTGVRNRIAYGAAKGGVNQLVKCMAIDCAQYHIRVNAVCPGRVMSEMVSHLKESDGSWGGITKPYPLGLKGEPEHIAYAVLYLASDESEWVTGILLPVEGGYLSY